MVLVASLYFGHAVLRKAAAFLLTVVWIQNLLVQLTMS